MKTIIAGGRNYELSLEDEAKISAIHKEAVITEVISGGCPTGTDPCGEEFAKVNNIPLKIFPANWGFNGRAAGPIRNRQMAEYADALIIFPGGKGTVNMYLEAVRAGIKIYDYQ